MNDQTPRPGAGQPDDTAPLAGSGSRWEPGEPDHRADETRGLPEHTEHTEHTEAAPGATTSDRRRRLRRGGLAGAVAVALLLVGGGGGYAIGHTTAGDGDRADQDGRFAGFDPDGDGDPDHAPDGAFPGVPPTGEQPPTGEPPTDQAPSTGTTPDDSGAASS